MKQQAQRCTVDLSDYPDLVVIYLGMRVNKLAGLKTLFGFAPKISRSVKTEPPGLLAHEYFLFSLLPTHLGIRQYWRDFESLENYARSDPHRQWWQEFLRNTGGTGFWHETYLKAGGMEAVYVDIVDDIGLRQFAPVQPARKRMFSARSRANVSGTPESAEPISEDEFYT